MKKVKKWNKLNAKLKIKGVRLSLWLTMGHFFGRKMCQPGPVNKPKQTKIQTNKQMIKQLDASLYPRGIGCHFIKSMRETSMVKTSDAENVDIEW